MKTPAADPSRALKLVVWSMGLLLLGGMILLLVAIGQKKSHAAACQDAAAEVEGMRNVEAIGVAGSWLAVSVATEHGSQLLFVEPCTGKVRNRLTLSPAP